jgi:hypothetical protein
MDVPICFQVSRPFCLKNFKARPAMFFSVVSSHPNPLKQAALPPLKNPGIDQNNRAVDEHQTACCKERALHPLENPPHVFADRFRKEEFSVSRQMGCHYFNSSRSP